MLHKPALNMTWWPLTSKKIRTTCHSHQDSPNPCEWSCRGDIPARTVFSTSLLCDLKIYLAAAWERNSTAAELDSSKVHCASCTCDTSLKQGLQKEVAIKFPFQSTKILHLLIKFQLGPQAIEQNTSLATAFCFTYCYWHRAVTHSEKSQSLGLHSWLTIPSTSGCWGKADSTFQVWFLLGVGFFLPFFSFKTVMGVWNKRRMAHPLFNSPWVKDQWRQWQDSHVFCRHFRITQGVQWGSLLPSAHWCSQMAASTEGWKDQAQRNPPAAWSSDWQHLWVVHARSWVLL